MVQEGKCQQRFDMCREYQRYGNFLGLKGEATNVAESQSQLKQKGDFTNKLSDKDIEQSRKEGTPADRCAHTSWLLPEAATLQQGSAGLSELLDQGLGQRNTEREIPPLVQVCRGLHQYWSMCTHSKNRVL